MGIGLLQLMLFALVANISPPFDVHELDYDVAIDYLLVNKMIVNFNMFSTGMKHRIRGQGKCTDIVTP